MGDEIKKVFGAEVQYIAGAGGILDVKVDGKEIYSKAKTGRFPEPEELVGLIKSL